MIEKVFIWKLPIPDNCFIWFDFIACLRWRRQRTVEMIPQWLTLRTRLGVGYIRVHIVHSRQSLHRKRIWSKISSNLMNSWFLNFFLKIMIRGNICTCTADITFFTLLMTNHYWWQPLNFLRGWRTVISHKEEGRWYFRRGEGVARCAGEGDTGRLGDAEEEQGPQTDDGQTGKADLCCN